MNNLKIIQNFLTFNSDDEFYFLQILKRKKENPELGSNSKVIKTYCITSVTELEELMPYIIHLCEYHNARAYINLSPRSFEKIAFHTLKKVTDIILNKDYKSVRGAYSSVCGSYGTTLKRWVIDIDDKDFNNVLKVAEKIKKCETSSSTLSVILGYIPTKNGWHIITNPFNLLNFDQVSLINIPVDIHKNNPSILYFI